MAESLDCIADVRQFAKSNQLLKALEEVDPLMRDTANFISQYSSSSLTSGWNHDFFIHHADSKHHSESYLLEFQG